MTPSFEASPFQVQTLTERILSDVIRDSFPTRQLVLKLESNGPEDIALPCGLPIPSGWDDRPVLAKFGHRFLAAGPHFGKAEPQRRLGATRVTSYWPPRLHLASRLMWQASRCRLQPLLRHQRQQFQRGPTWALRAPFPLAHESSGDVQIARKDRLTRLLPEADRTALRRAEALHRCQTQLVECLHAPFRP